MKIRHVLLAAAACTLIHAPFALGAQVVHSGDIAKRGFQKSDFPLLKELTPGVYAYSGTLGPMNGVTITTVSLIVVTPEGVAVIDGQDDVPQTQALIDTIKKLTSQPVKYVVVASDHSDHVGGNAAFKAAWPDVVFLASPVSQKRLAQTAHPPTEAVMGRRTISLGKTDIQLLNLGRAHTGGDLVAYLPASKVLFMGEIYLHQVFPALTTAYPTEWVEVIKKAQAMDVSWYVAGHGFIDDAATMKHDLQESLQALEYVIAEGKRLHAAGVACESRANCLAVQKANWGPYAEWTLRDQQAPIALSKVYEEIEGKLPE